MTTCSNVKFLSAYRDVAKTAKPAKFGSAQPAVAAPAEPSTLPAEAQVSTQQLTDALKGQVRFGNNWQFNSTASMPFSQTGARPRASQLDVRTSTFPSSSAVGEAPVTMLPSMVEEVNGHPITMDPISWMFANNIIYLNGPINQASSLAFIAQLDALTTKIMLQRAARGKEADQDGEKDVLPKDEIRIYINSPGGSVIDLYGMVDAMQRTQSHDIPIATYCRGMAASAGSVILALGSPGRRYITPLSKVMIHQPLGGAQGQATDIDIENNLIQEMKQTLTELLANSTNGKKTYPELLQVMERDHWLGAKQALEYGLVDHIANA